ncbi:replication-associated recombination protein A [Candidatus Hydrogenedentota bacterium]
MDLFDEERRERREQAHPLARRAAPRRLEDFVGQQHILGPGKLLRRAIEADRLSSVIFYGPPGTGKTALARIVARRTQSAFENLNAVTSGVRDVRALIAKAKARLEDTGARTILFIDEIHRFNKAQQDALLPDIEAGTITLIGATTMNPFFSINAPILSRSQIFEFCPLSEDELGTVLHNALTNPSRGFDHIDVELDDDARVHFVRCADGDARRLLVSVELAVLTTAPDDKNRVSVTLKVAEESSQRKAMVYDGTGDDHYDTISAFIKSLRGSDPDSALYWLAKMLRAGEDPRFLARRLVIAASEDVGNADPMALSVAIAAHQAVEFVGLPEAAINLAQATTYIASAPKSNAAYAGLTAARKHIEEERSTPTPGHLQDTAYAGSKRLNRGKGYRYPHSFPENFVKQFYGAQPGQFYKPTDNGFEASIRQRLEKLWGDDEYPK